MEVDRNCQLLDRKSGDLPELSIERGYRKAATDYCNDAVFRTCDQIFAVATHHVVNKRKRPSSKAATTAVVESGDDVTIARQPALGDFCTAVDDHDGDVRDELKSSASLLQYSSERKRSPLVYREDNCGKIRRSNEKFDRGGQIYRLRKRSGGIMRAVMEGRNFFVFPRPVSFVENGPAIVVQGADGLKNETKLTLH
uniref:Uncharacterized protein n=1 Tax=Romanomermis culicivorax TaxID=13658 RepID=A0A915KYI9_ROMCU